MKELAVRYQNELKFKIVFAFEVMDFIAWFGHPRGLKFHLLNQFFCNLKASNNLGRFSIVPTSHVKI